MASLGPIPLRVDPFAPLELTIGAGLEFADRGSRVFKGISEERPVYEAQLVPSIRGARGSVRAPG